MWLAGPRALLGCLAAAVVGVIAVLTGAGLPGLSTPLTTTTAHAATTATTTSTNRILVRPAGMFRT
jgi:hypothetical protein